MTDVVNLKEISVTFGNETIYDRLSFSVRAGEFLCILGPSGCGKSTLLRVIADLLKVDGGRVEVAGKSAHEAWQEMAFVFQAPRLLPWRTAEDNVVFSQQLRFGSSVAKENMQKRARELLDLVGLGKDKHKMPAMLSGGERQRVSIARALAVDPRIILMDEPFSALDLNTRRHMRTEVTTLWQKTGKTIIFVTHEIDEAIELADRIVVLSNKPTSVQAIIELDDPRPRNARSAKLTAVHDHLRSLIGNDASEGRHVA